MKKTISLLLCLAILTGAVCSCSKNATAESASNETNATAETNETIETADTTETDETLEPFTDPTETQLPKRNGHYTFNPYVSSSVMDSIMPDKMDEAYINLVEAVISGETSFKCQDQDTYDWVMGQYAYLFFPVIAEYVVIPTSGPIFENGVGYLEYTIPYEEFEVKLTEFEDKIVTILNENLEDDFSDLEKALALYLYMVNTYTYDWDTYNKMTEENVDGLSSYRLLMGGTGICQEISVLYSYLLLQAGVDATVMKGVREFDNANHQWSFVTIDGNYYHVDPTYGLGFTDLRYFMMTDDERYLEDGYNPDWFIPATVYAQFYGFPEIPANDDRYSSLWNSIFVNWDPDSNTINYQNYDGQESVFDYGES